MSEEDKLFQTSERIFQALNDDTIMDGIKIVVPNHIKCLRKGAILTIKNNGIWCDLDDPEPEEVE